MQFLEVRDCATQIPGRLVLLDVILCGTSLLLSVGQLFQQDLQLAGYFFVVVVAPNSVPQAPLNRQPH